MTPQLPDLLVLLAPPAVPDGAGVGSRSGPWFVDLLLAAIDGEAALGHPPVIGTAAPIGVEEEAEHRAESALASDPAGEPLASEDAIEVVPPAAELRAAAMTPPLGAVPAPDPAPGGGASGPPAEPVSVTPSPQVAVAAPTIEAPVLAAEQAEAAGRTAAEPSMPDTGQPVAAASQPDVVPSRPIAPTQDAPGPHVDAAAGLGSSGDARPNPAEPTLNLLRTPRPGELPVSDPESLTEVGRRSPDALVVADAAASPVETSGPTAAAPPETSAAPAVVERILDAVEALENAPPPRRLTVEVGNSRFAVSIRGETVHVAVLGEGVSVPPPPDLGRDLSLALAQRGLQLGQERTNDPGQERRNSRDRAPHDPQPPAPRRPAAPRAPQRDASGWRI